MSFKFEKLKIWDKALELIDLVYEISDELPPGENFNLKSQMTRAVVSVGLNIAEGSTGQTNAEQIRFLGYAYRSVMETVATLKIIQRRNFPNINENLILKTLDKSAELAPMIQAMRNSLGLNKPWTHEPEQLYKTNLDL